VLIHNYYLKRARRYFPAKPWSFSLWFQQWFPMKLTAASELNSVPETLHRAGCATGHHSTFVFVLESKSEGGKRAPGCRHKNVDVQRDRGGVHHTVTVEIISIRNNSVLLIHESDHHESSHSWAMAQ
jgi:hypothetical protein